MRAVFHRFRGVAFAAAWLLGFAVSSRAESSRPNIVIIVSDDHGYAEIGSQGCKDVPTPNIDSLATSGVRFSNGYVSCPVCSPTRAGLQTGRYQQRFGHELNPGPPKSAEPNFGLPLSEVTLADRLKSAGYATGLVGKWHLGYRPELHPLKRGYDEFFGFLAGQHDYLEWDDKDRGPLLRGTSVVEEKEYLTDALAREAVAFIDRHKSQPFMLMLTFNAVHSPLEAIDKYRARFSSITDKKHATFAAMLSAMDDAVGQVLAKLRRSGLEENTLVFFVSDNGGPTPQTTSSNLPLRGYKGDVWEGGIRVPFLVQWKGHIPAGKVYDQPVIALDIHPTCLAASGGMFEIPEKKALDGVDLLPYLTGKESGSPHRELFWRYGRKSAVRQGNYKLVQINDETHLFDLSADIGEQKDLASDKPELVKELKAVYAGWNRQLIPPAWGAGDNAVKARNKKGQRS